jgi:triosephosphate isomerase
LAKICDKVSAKYKVNIVVAPQYIDLKEICSKVKIPVFAQHIDSVEPGAHTGHIVAENLKEIGVTGTLINHAEKRLELEEIGKCVEIARKNNLISVCCSPSIDNVKEIAKFNPDFIAFEDPTLIGTLRSVSRLKPKTVKDFAEILKNINPKIIPLCGAGVANGDDVKSALKLGTKGVLVATAVVKAEDPEKVLLDFVKNTS